MDTGKGSLYFTCELHQLILVTNIIFLQLLFRLLQYVTYIANF